MLTLLAPTQCFLSLTLTFHGSWETAQDCDWTSLISVLSDLHLLGGMTANLFFIVKEYFVSEWCELEKQQTNLIKGRFLIFN